MGGQPVGGRFYHMGGGGGAALRVGYRKPSSVVLLSQTEGPQRSGVDPPLGSNPGRSLTEKKNCSETWFFQKRPRVAHMFNIWLVAIGGWRLVVGGWRQLAAVGGSWQLVMGGWWWLAAVDGWRLVAVGGWRLAVGGSWWIAVGGPLGRSLTKKKSGPLRTALLQLRLPHGLHRQLSSIRVRVSGTAPSSPFPSPP